MKQPSIHSVGPFGHPDAHCGAKSHLRGVLILAKRQMKKSHRYPLALVILVALSLLFAPSAAQTVPNPTPAALPSPQAQLDLNAAAAFLADPDVETRRLAAASLGADGIAPAVVPLLLDALLDKDPEVRWRAEFAIGRLGPRAVPKLIEALASNRPSLRRTAAMMLGPIGPKARSAVPALLQAAKDEDRFIRVWSVKALGDIGFDDSAAPQVLAQLAKTLRDPDLDVRRVSTVAAIGLGPRAKPLLPSLIEALRDRDAGIRWRTGIALRQMGSDAADAVPALVAALSDADADVRLRAAQALGRIGAPAEAPLRDLLAAETTNAAAKKFAAEVLAALGTPDQPASQSPPEQSEEELKDRAARAAWFNEAKFGIFIHWGLYSTLARARPGQLSEWVMDNEKIPLNKYEPLAEKFTAEKFDPAAWVETFKATGARYVVLTSKHHDGFCLWDSKLSPYNSVRFAAAKRDIVGDLAAACERGGLKFSVYHSLLDWHHPDFAKDHPRYVDHLHGQIRELLTGYPISGLWFDGEWTHSQAEWRGQEIVAMSRQLRPLAVLNDRLGRDTRSRITTVDYYTKEQEIPPSALKLANRPVAWETCQTFGYSWGYNESLDPLKSGERIIEQLVDVASKGGNFLLNIGPRPDGVIPPAFTERMKIVGRFLQHNGEAIYGAQRSPFPAPLPAGRVTAKGNRLYIFLDNLPSTAMALPGLKNKVHKAWVLEGGETLSVANGPTGPTVASPTRLSPLPFTVVALELDSEPAVELQP